MRGRDHHSTEDRRQLHAGLVVAEVAAVLARAAVALSGWRMVTVKMVLLRKVGPALVGWRKQLGFSIHVVGLDPLTNLQPFIVVNLPDHGRWA